MITPQALSAPKELTLVYTKDPTATAPRVGAP